jgi:LPXTG-motif cell wall-anchored protein
VSVPDDEAYARSAGVPPASITKDGLIYRFIGYQIDDAPIQNSPWGTLPETIIDSVLANQTVSYLYANMTLEVTERYLTDKGEALIPAVSDKIVYINEGGDYVREIPVFSSYLLLGYFVGAAYDPDVDTLTPAVEIAIAPLAQNTTVCFIYQRISDFNFTKVDEANRPLYAVAFELYSCSKADDETHVHSGLVTTAAGCCWVNPVSVTSDSAGRVSFTGLPSGDYMLVETKTVTGYILPASQWLVRIDDSSSISITTQIASSDSKPPAFYSSAGTGLRLPNYPIPPKPLLPQTGDLFFVLLGVIGIALLSGTGLLFIYRKRRRTFNTEPSDDYKTQQSTRE